MKRAVTLAPRGNKLTTQYHIRLRLAKQRKKNELVTRKQGNPRRSTTPLPTQESAFDTFRSQAGIIVPSVKRRRRRHRKKMEDFDGAVRQYHKKASDLRNLIMKRRQRQEMENVPASWCSRPSIDYSGIDEFLFDATITLRMKVVFRRSYRKIPLENLFRMFTDFEIINRGVEHKCFESQAKFELYDEHHYVFPDGDIANPPFVDTKEARQERWNAPY